MKIVIELSDEDYKRIQDIPDVFNSLTSRTYSAIRNGTPLPKGHGRLIDADELLDANIDTFSQQTELKIKFAPTIIEAEEGDNE